jgi:hypothetical protein
MQKVGGILDVGCAWVKYVLDFDRYMRHTHVLTNGSKYNGQVVNRCGQVLADPKCTLLKSITWMERQHVEEQFSLRRWIGECK